MPELPEVETWRRLAAHCMLGRKILRAQATSDSIVMDLTPPHELATRISGATVIDTGRRGKHCWLTLDSPSGHLYIHFGMSGSLVLLNAQEALPDHTKLSLQLEDGRTLVYRDPRRLGRLRWYADISAAPPIARLGPDPLLDGISTARLRQKLRRRSAPIKCVLLDQSIFAGVGNWIADEVLYQSRLNPFTPACDLEMDDIQRLARNLATILRTAVEAEADDARFPRTWLFHTRWGKSSTHTLRGEAIRYDVIGGRTCAWVPSRQTLPPSKPRLNADRTR